MLTDNGDEQKSLNGVKSPAMATRISILKIDVVYSFQFRLKMSEKNLLCLISILNVEKYKYLSDILANIEYLFWIFFTWCENISFLGCGPDRKNKWLQQYFVKSSIWIYRSHNSGTHLIHFNVKIQMFLFLISEWVTVFFLEKIVDKNITRMGTNINHQLQ